MILFTGGGCLPQCMLGYTPPRSRHPPSRHPPEQTPQSRHPFAGSRPPPEQTPSPQSRPHPSRHPPPPADHARRYGQRAGGTHPTGMQSCIIYFVSGWDHGSLGCTKCLFQFCLAGLLKYGLGNIAMYLPEPRTKANAL